MTHNDAFYEQIAALAALPAAERHQRFAAIHDRIVARGLTFWGDPFKRMVNEVNHGDGGRGLYWEDPDRHMLEIITRIASGEHEATIYGFRELLRNHAAHVLQPDLTWSGGLTDARRVAAAADAAGVLLIPHRGGSVYGMTLLLTTRGPSLRGP